MGADSAAELRLDELARSYDEIPYHRFAATSFHPDRIAPLATILGLAFSTVRRPSTSAASRRSDTRRVVR